MQKNKCKKIIKYLLLHIQISQSTTTTNNNNNIYKYNTMHLLSIKVTNNNNNIYNLYFLIY